MLISFVFFLYYIDPACVQIDTKNRCYALDPTCQPMKSDDETISNYEAILYPCLGVLVVACIIAAIFLIHYKKCQWCRGTPRNRRDSGEGGEVKNTFISMCNFQIPRYKLPCIYIFVFGNKRLLENKFIKFFLNSVRAAYIGAKSKTLSK